MAQILKFPAQASKRGYRRVRQRPSADDSAGQLNLFPATSALILDLTGEMSPFAQALLLDERGDPRAAEFYLKAIEAADCIVDAYCNLGIIESQKGNTAKALDCFTTSLQHDPRHSEAHYNLGNLYFDLQDYRLAVVHFELASRIDPSFANVHFNLGLVQAITNDLAGAVNALSKFQKLVTPEEGRIAEELLQSLKKSLAVLANSQSGLR